MLSAGLMMMHMDLFVTKWVTKIMELMGDICVEGFYVPMYALFCNEISSPDIIESKRNLFIRCGTFDSTWYISSTWLDLISQHKIIWKTSWNAEENSLVSVYHARHTNTWSFQGQVWIGLGSLHVCALIASDAEWRCVFQFGGLNPRMKSFAAAWAVMNSSTWSAAYNKRLLAIF